MPSKMSHFILQLIIYWKTACAEKQRELHNRRTWLIESYMTVWMLIPQRVEKIKGRRKQLSRTKGKLPVSLHLQTVTTTKTYSNGINWNRMRTQLCNSNLALSLLICAERYKSTNSNMIWFWSQTILPKDSVSGFTFVLRILELDRPTDSIS